MSCDPDLAAYGLTEVKDALGALEDGVLRQACGGYVGRARAGRAGGLLRVLETIVRRILLLMALALRLPAIQPRPRADAAPGETGPGFPLPRRRYMRMVLPCLDFPGVDALSGKAHRSGSVPVLPMLVRIGALARVLARPEAAARLSPAGWSGTGKPGNLPPSSGRSRASSRAASGSTARSPFWPGRCP